MNKKSSGILLYRLINGYLEILLLHPGGPFYLKKDLEVWSIPKGEFEDEDPKIAALREFKEETGLTLSDDLHYLGEIKMKSGKLVYCWAKEGDFDISLFKSNLFDLEWPPKSSKIQQFPEMDRAEWFIYNEVKNKIHPSQLSFVDKLIDLLKLSNSEVYPVVRQPNTNKGGQLDLFS
jgi:predicted NUDIX family NTP pyrophosphohydrolase